MEKKLPNYRVVTPVKRGDKTVWLTIGAGWDRLEGKGVSIKIDLMPLPHKGALSILLAPIEDKPQE